MSVADARPARQHDVPRRRPTGLYAAIALIMLAATVARFWSIGRESYWIDELYTLETSAGNGLAHERLSVGEWFNAPLASITDVTTGGGISGIVTHSPQDTQAPLYFATLNVWRRLFGSSETAVRSLSAICSLLAVPALGAMLNALSLPRAALLAMALAAVSGAQVVFAQEARPYAMTLLFLLLASLAVVSIERRGFTLARCTALAATLLALMLTHYTGLAPAIALFAYVLVRLRGRARLQTLAAFAIAGCAFAVLWGSTVLAQRREAMDRLVFLRDDSAGHTLRTLDRALCQPLSMLLAAPNVSSQPVGWLWAARLVGAVLFAAPVAILLMRAHPAILLPWMLLIFPIGQTAIADLYLARAALELPRFSFLASAGALATSAVLIMCILPMWAARVASFLAVAWMSVALVFSGLLGRGSAYDRGKPDFRRLGAELARQVQPGDALVVAVPMREPWQAGTLFAGVTQYAGAWPGPIVLLGSPPDDAITARLRTAPRIWMLSPTPNLPNQVLLPGSTIDDTSIKSVRHVGTAARLILR